MIQLRDSSSRAVLRRLAAVLCVWLIAPRALQAETPTSFQIYYGADSDKLQEIERSLTAGRLLVLDVRIVKPDDLRRIVKRARDVNAKVLTYLSIGEMADYRVPNLKAYAKSVQRTADVEAAVRSIVISRNAAFKSQHVDVSDELWRAFVLAQADVLMKTGVDGLFLDTVDTVDVYSRKQDWPLSRRAQSVTAMIKFVRTIKSRYAEKYVLQNRGLNLIGPTVFVGTDKGIEIKGMSIDKPNPTNPDGVLFESAFIASDDWSRLRIKQLESAKAAGAIDVFALGYKDTGVTKTHFFRTASAHGFIAAYGNSSKTLDREATQSPPN